MNSTSVESIEILIIETFDKIKEKEREYQKLQKKIVVTFSLSAIVLGVFCWFFVKNFLILILIGFFFVITSFIVYKTKFYTKEEKLETTISYLEMKLKSLEYQYELEKTSFEGEQSVDNEKFYKDVDLKKYIAFKEYYILLSLLLYNFYDNPKIETICCMYLNTGVNPRKKIADIPISKEQETNLKKVFDEEYEKIMEGSLGGVLSMLLKKEMDNLRSKSN